MLEETSEKSASEGMYVDWASLLLDTWLPLLCWILSVTIPDSKDSIYSIAARLSDSSFLLEISSTSCDSVVIELPQFRTLETCWITQSTNSLLVFKSLSKAVISYWVDMASGELLIGFPGIGTTRSSQASPITSSDSLMLSLNPIQYHHNIHLLNHHQPEEQVDQQLDWIQAVKDWKNCLPEIDS